MRRREEVRARRPQPEVNLPGAPRPWCRERPRYERIASIAVKGIVDDLTV
jgi:hypothetical protein